MNSTHGAPMRKLTFEGSLPTEAAKQLLAKKRRRTANPTPKTSRQAGGNYAKFMSRVPHTTLHKPFPTAKMTPAVSNNEVVPTFSGS